MQGNAQAALAKRWFAGGGRQRRELLLRPPPLLGHDARSMVTARAKRELERTASWSSVRSGLGWFAGAWLVLTVAGVGVQLHSLRLAPGVAARDPSAMLALAIASYSYQAVYAVLAIVVAVALLRITRVPPSTRAVTPALIAAVSFVAVVVLTVALLLGVSGGSSESMSTRELWSLVGAARAVGLLALVLAFARIGKSLERPLAPVLVGACFALAAVDAGFPLYRLWSVREGAAPTTERSGLILVQVALAIALVDAARRVRAAVTPEARAEAERPREPESDTPVEEEDEPGSEPDARAPTPHAPSELPPAFRNLAALAVFGLVGLLPMWDAVLAANSVGALGDALTGAPGTEWPKVGLAMCVGGALAALVLRRWVQTAPYAARGLLLLAVLASLGYSAPVVLDAARFRSRQIDGWPVCETGLDTEGNLPNLDSIYRGTYDGPRLPTGEPCTLAAERRDRHAESAPHGELTDGLIQIGSRFPDDRRRVFWGSAIWSVLTVFAFFWVWRAAEYVSSTAARRDREPRGESAD